MKLFTFDSSRNSKSLITAWTYVALFFVMFIILPLGGAVFSVKSDDIRYVFSNDIWKTALINTFIECICSTTLSVVIGYIFAYAVEKGGIPFKKFFSIIPLLHIIMPPFVCGLSFIFLFGRQGIITHKILGLDVSLYGLPALVIAQVLCFFPIAYLICAENLRGINLNLEKAASVMGAGRFKIFFTVTLPLSVPAIVSSFLFIAVGVMSDFGNPLIVGGRFRVLAVELYTQLTGWLKVGSSVVLGLLLMIPSLALFFLQGWFSKKNEKKASVVGAKGDFSKKLDQNAGGQKMPLVTRVLLTIFVVFVSSIILLQVGSLVVGSFQKLWGIDSTFTLKHVKSVVKYLVELKNSVLFAFLGAVLSVSVAIFSAYIVNRTDFPLRKTIDVLSQISSAIPGSLLGLSFSIMANKLNFGYSPLLIVAVMATAFLPFAYRSVSGSFMQISRSLDDGSRSLGANQIHTLNAILLPVSRGGILSAFIYNFIRGTGTLSTVIFLVSFDTPLASVTLINLAELGEWGKAASLAVVLTLLTFVILFAGLLIDRIFIKYRKHYGAKNGISFYK